MKMIQLSNVVAKYPGGEGLELVNLTIEPGEFVYLVGPSGAGKSSVLKVIYLDIFPQSGHVIVNGFNSLTIKKKKIPYLRRKLGIIFQDFKLLNDRTVYDNVAFALQVIGTSRGEIKRRVLRVLAEVGLSHKRNKMPYQLSGGEQQRVAIARALVNEPIILLADEPTGNLDPAAADEIIQLIEKINSRGTAILMATHDYRLVREHRRKVIRIEKGRTL
ncbi:MAG: cell division ATP-binding protein FtsE [candidate division KSB1 bacterium]|nr:cell division ATP-binding protein FtsE [candidate division KSB1 bacterium]MDZ7335257.1 cell division ATP-binding protein FtsE [candidate division KSB1 bacterium]MDZ7357993.1 cell division ATP-binding protein FtsE [candidate division KSB1 bacterium]MDZ7399794.1 cell division ATP-binding protein FtsE [candidate division KSB1 bacterium]